VNVAVEYARQILSALKFAHRHGIVHATSSRTTSRRPRRPRQSHRLRDRPRGHEPDGPSRLDRRNGAVLSPEQARGTEVDQRSDLYSLGVVLYELLTGQTPFGRRHAGRDAMKHLSATPRPPSQIRRDVPRDIDMVVMRALAKDPDARYQNADEMESDLERALRGAPVAAATTDFATQVMRTAPPLPPVKTRPRR